MSQFLYALPALACPVGMGLMMWFMMRSGRNTTTPPAGADPREQELAALRKEIDGLRTQVTPRSGAPERERTP
ncbi:hypothetical protein [Streptomyces albicerus]|uniref:hypothetical protein n=1 Tax=Streptomyces albicerus TaxID=2569859 RepID=UPI00124B0B20|nr:hypothetical protein [Streptomyces albicerus]